MAAGEKGEPMNRNRTSLARTSDREIVITRVFNAPARIVFDAWTKPEHVRRWWAPDSLGVRLVECDADVRPGGAYRYVLAPEGSDRFAFYGKYLEISRPTRIVYTQGFEMTNAASLEAGARPAETPDADAAALVTVTFEENAGSTTLVAHERYPSKEVLDGVLATGMEEGMLATFDQLDKLLESLRG